MHKFFLITLSSCFMTCAWSQTSSPESTSIALQRSGISAMNNSIAAQKAAVRKQFAPAPSAPSEASIFFLLPRVAVTARPPSTPQFVQPAWNCPALQASEIFVLAGEAAAAEGIDIDLLRGVMKQESGFHPCAVSPKGALGLMQLMPDTARQLGVASPFDPSANVNGGARLLKQLLTRYGGDLSKTLGAYNAGTSRVDAANGVPAIAETQNYVQQILGTLRQ